jgi:hypothetical protein
MENTKTAEGEFIVPNDGKKLYTKTWLVMPPLRFDNYRSANDLDC